MPCSKANKGGSAEIQNYHPYILASNPSLFHRTWSFEPRRRLRPAGVGFTPRYPPHGVAPMPRLPLNRRWREGRKRPPRVSLMRAPEAQRAPATITGVHGEGCAQRKEGRRWAPVDRLSQVRSAPVRPTSRPHGPAPGRLQLRTRRPPGCGPGCTPPPQRAPECCTGSPRLFPRRSPSGEDSAAATPRAPRHPPHAGAHLLRHGE